MTGTAGHSAPRPCSSLPEWPLHHCLRSGWYCMVAMVAAGCGFYGDGPQWQEDSRGFSYLVASRSPPPTPSQQHTGAASAVAVYRGEGRSQLPPRHFTAGYWKDRLHRTVSASRGDCRPEQFGWDGDGWLMFEPSRLRLWGPSPKSPSLEGGFSDVSVLLTCQWV